MREKERGEEGKHETTTFSQIKGSNVVCRDDGTSELRLPRTAFRGLLRPRLGGAGRAAAQPDVTESAVDERLAVLPKDTSE